MLLLFPLLVLSLSCCSSRQTFSSSSSGQGLTAQEKYAAIARRVNEEGQLAWPEVSATNIENKIDTMRRKARKIYRLCRIRARRGPPAEEDFDLEVGSVGGEEGMERHRGDGAWKKQTRRARSELPGLVFFREKKKKIRERVDGRPDHPLVFVLHKP